MQTKNTTHTHTNTKNLFTLYFSVGLNAHICVRSSLEQGWDKH